MSPTVFAPWDLGAVRKVNGRHPLLMSLLEDQPDLTVAMTADDARIEETVRHAGTLIHRLAALGPGRAAAERFVDSRDLGDQARMSAGPEDALLFLHTTPMTLGQRPWILHIEEMLTLFEPDIGHGRSMDVDIRRQPVFAFVKHLLEAPECRAVFTHLKHSADWLGRLFESDGIAGKTRYLPLGHALPPSLAAKADAAWDDKTDTKGAGHFLFTGSWNNHGGSFVQRGGIEVAMAFERLVRDYPTAHLTMRTSLPDSIREPFGAYLERIPNLTWLREPIDDDALVDLFLEADVFLLPAAGLHSISLLRAMTTGAVLLTADAPGVAEFVTPDETCAAVDLFQPDWSHWDTETGLLRQDYRVYEAGHNRAFVEPLRSAMAGLLDDPDRRRRLRRAARDRVLRHHPVAPWRRGFATLVHDLTEG